MEFKKGDKAIVTKAQLYLGGFSYYEGEVVEIIRTNDIFGNMMCLTTDGYPIPEDDLMSIELKHYDEVVNRSASRFAEELVTTSSKKCDCGAHAVGSEMHDDFCSLYKGVA